MKRLIEFLRRHQSHLTNFLFGFFSGIIVGIGIVFSPKDFVVEPEYVSSILASSSILFGFWSLLIGVDTRKKKNTQTFKRDAGVVTLVNFVLLTLSVIVIYFAGVGIFAPKFALASLIWGFLFNVFFVARFVYVYLKQSSSNGQ